MSVTSSSMAQLVSALGPDDDAAKRRAVRRLRWVVFLLSVVLYAVVIAGGIVDLRWAWYANDWSAFWPTGGVLIFWSLIPLILLIGIRAATAAPSEGKRLSARALREAAAHPDDQVAPPVLLQPAPQEGEHLVSGTTRIGPLTSPTAKASPTAALDILLVAMLIASFAAVALVSLSDFGPSSSSSPDFSAWFPSVFVFFSIILNALRLTQIRRPLYATVDERGIEWHLGKRARKRRPGQRVEWDQVRSLAQIDGLATTYLLIAPDAQLIWTAPATNAKASAASEQLLRVVVTRTGKPLRDLSTVARDLVRSDGTAARVLGRLHADTGLPAAVPSPLGVYPPPMRHRQGRNAAGIVMTLLIPLLFIGSLFGTDAWLQAYTPQYYASLPARIVASKSLYHDDLSTANGYWDLQTPTTDGLGGAAFIGDTYQLYGLTAGYYTEDYEPRDFGDAAYAVTATERGTVPKGYSDGVGLVLHATDDTLKELVFRVDREGDWGFWSYRYIDRMFDDNWTRIAGGQSSAIHTGDGEANRLMVVAHGDTYLFYVNGQYLGQHQATSDEALPSLGKVGVYLQDTSMTGVFTQFDVYALPQTAWWEPV